MISQIFVPVLHPLLFELNNPSPAVESLQLVVPPGAL